MVQNTKIIFPLKNVNYINQKKFKLKYEKSDLKSHIQWFDQINKENKIAHYSKYKNT